MKPEELQTQVLKLLSTIAPELDAASLRADKPLRNQIDLDSMDWLNFLVALHERLKVDIPEADYGKLATLDQLLAYLKEKLPA
ncbi:MAG TPA: acyl carrier protein [Burkholderiales bacterium]|nr:acyl carrier protein [Burkholderiales bacterium]